MDIKTSQAWRIKAAPQLEVERCIVRVLARHPKGTESKSEWLQEFHLYLIGEFPEDVPSRLAWILEDALKDPSSLPKAELNLATGKPYSLVQERNVVEAVCTYARIEKARLYSRSNGSDVRFARVLAVVIFREDFGRSFKQAAEAVGVKAKTAKRFYDGANGSSEFSDGLRMVREKLAGVL